MKHLLIIIALLPFLANAQSKGIKFHQEITWNELLTRAKSEHKYVLIDCYATWCAPCKQMDAQVFTNENIGKFVNEEFIAYKVQMDSTRLDSQTIRSHYGDKNKIGNLFPVTSLPTYLVLSPEGQLVNHVSGFLPVSSFAFFLANSLNPLRQYDALLFKFNHGELNPAEISTLLKRAVELEDRPSATLLATSYINRYLSTLPTEKLTSRENLDFMDLYSYGLTSAQPVFRLLVDHADQIDSTDHRRELIRGIIIKVMWNEILNPFFNQHLNNPKVPDWAALKVRLSENFPKVLASQGLLTAKATWFLKWKHFDQAIRYQAELTDLAGIDTAGYNWVQAHNLNEGLFLRYCNDKTILKKAVKWEKIILAAHPAFEIDEAQILGGLLYKSGEIDEGIYWTSYASKKEHEKAAEEKRPDTSFIHQNLKYMMQRAPWSSFSGYLKHLDENQ